MANHSFRSLVTILVSFLAVGSLSAGEIKQWYMDATTGAVDSVELDTGLVGVENWNPVTAYSLASAWNGTWGSPVQSKIWNPQGGSSDFLFAAPYLCYLSAPDQMEFYNTKTPYSKLSYRTFGGSQTNESDFSALFTVNAGRKLNFGGLAEYMRGRGMYSEQATRQIKIGFWGSLNTKWYDASLRYMRQQFDNEENGGILSDDYLTKDSLRPDDPSQIPVRLSNGAQSRYLDNYIWLNQKVHLAVKPVRLDSEHVEYRPIASLWHTMMWQVSEKRYRESVADTAKTFYNTRYSVFDTTKDSAAQNTISNSVGIQMDEGWTRWVPFSLTTYLKHFYQSYTWETDSVSYREKEENLHHVAFGAELAKRKGENLTFGFAGETLLYGEDKGDWSVDGHVDANFNIGNQELQVGVYAQCSKLSPIYFVNKYSGSYQRWDNDFAREYRQLLGGTVAWKNDFVNINAIVEAENLKNYIYFGYDALPAQSQKDIQVVKAEGNLDFTLGIVHLDNKLAWQKSSDDSILALPSFATRNNLYMMFRMFKKTLQTQIGAEMDYHVAYYAPAYMPSIGAFYNQKEVKVGNYPLVSAYIAFRLYQARFYFKYYHLNAELSNHKYFSMAHYPLYGSRFQMGFVWYFYD